MGNTLLQKIAAGDREAVAGCIERYGGLIWTLARQMTPRGDDPEDAVQEIFIELWKKADRFDPAKGDEVVFVSMIARRRLIDRLRSHERKPDINSVDDLGDLSAAPQNQEQSADAALAARAMAELTPDQRSVLTLSLKWGMSHGEIAEVTKTAVGTVKTHIRRGLISLRKRLLTRRQTQSRRAE